MQVYRLDSNEDRRTVLKNIGVEPGGVSIMSEKMELFWILIKNLKTPAANILKQDALSIGAELAVPRGTVTCSHKSVDCILIANRSQILKLSQKEKSQPFGLKNLADELKRYLAEYDRKIKIMGVINANNDSFYSGSRYYDEEAINAIEQMIEDGADIIDIGAVSSRPGSEPVSEDEELSRFKNIADTVKESRLYEKAVFSIDSYSPKVVKYALDCGFSIINDITGASDERVVNLAVEYGAKYCIMHMKGTPQNMQKDPRYDDVVAEVDIFFEERISFCEERGLKRSDIILDVGIGFGKTLEHNISLLKHHKNFLKHGCELLIGASRKSMIDMIIPTPVEHRLPGTLAIHLKAIQNGATILRCHDVKEHIQALRIWKRI